MADWNDEYYERKEREHIELVECWAYAFVVCLAIAVGVAVILGVAAVVRWLIGGA